MSFIRDIINQEHLPLPLRFFVVIPCAMVSVAHPVMRAIPARTGMIKSLRMTLTPFLIGCDPCIFRSRG